MDIILIFSGLLILFIGGEALIKGAISIASHLNISRILVSSVIVGFGTSMPEMTISVDAMLKNFPEIAIGNIIGSNIANCFFILGVASLISPIYLKDQFINRDVAIMVIATLILVIFGMTGKIVLIHGLVMLTILIFYISYSYFNDKKNFSKSDIENIESDLGVMKNANLFVSIIVCITGFGLLISGSSLFLEGSISLARKFNISNEIIGLGIVAIGSCLPELATAIVASYRKHGNIVIASIIGSNIFNILSILGVVSIIEQITMPINIMKFDIWVFLAATIIVAILVVRKIEFSRLIGFIFLLFYVLYFYILFFGTKF